MAATPRTPTSPVRALDANTELWLLRAGPRVELAARVASFAGTALTRVLCSPGGEEEVWAGAFSAASSAPLEPTPAFAVQHADETLPELAARAWLGLESVLAAHPARLLAVLPHPVLTAVVARALALPPAGARALRVDPGRAVLLRTGASGFVLRRSNALAPERDPGTALPDGSPSGAR